MSNIFKYKSFSGSCEVSIEDACLFGKILFIRDTVLYHAENVKDLESAFIEAVEQYLADCQDLGVTPEKPLSGSFNVRIGSERHHGLALQAHKRSTSINALVIEGVDLFLRAEPEEDLVEAYYAEQVTLPIGGAKLRVVK